MLEHRYDIRMWESCVEPNLLMVERQDPDNCIRFQTQERCALEIAAYVFNIGFYAYAIIGHTRADHLLPQLLMEQFDTLPIPCRHIEHMHKGVWFRKKNF